MKELAHLNKYFLKYKYHFVLGIFFVIISNVFAIFPAQIIRHSFDVVQETVGIYHLFAGFSAGEEIYQIFALTLLAFGVTVLAMALLKGWFMFLMRQTLIVMSRHIEFDLKNELYEHYQTLSLSFYKRNNTGDLMARISEDVSRVRMYIGPAIMYSINLAVLFIIVITTMISVSPKLTFYVLLPLPVLSVSIYYISQLINLKSEEVQRQLSKLSTFTQENFAGIRVLKAFSREEATGADFLKECRQYKKKSLELVKINALFHPAMIVLIGLSTLLTIYIGGLEAIKGDFSMGNIAEFVVYINMLTWPFTAIGWVTSIIQRAAASQARINEFLQTKSEIQNPTQQEMEVKGKIEFRNVTFSYPDTGITALRDFSLTISPGETVAIVGRTGSGKSTIAALMCRQFDPEKGEVFMDDVPLRERNLDNIRKSIGYVPQDIYLFSNSIFNNIAFGALPAQESDMKNLVEEAARNASIYDSIISFPAGFETRIGERGITLSGGQKQRVSIARAIVRNPKVLIFDDCLSALDTQTEEKILSNLRRIMSDKTSVVISHRVSSVKDADVIIVLDNGSIVEKGKHNDLIAHGGVYAELYRKQLEEKVSEQAEE